LTELVSQPPVQHALAHALFPSSSCLDLVSSKAKHCNFRICSVTL
jgi:hypothetical protein